MKVLSFRLAGQLFGIDITVVKEINRRIFCTQTPTASEAIIGLYNMRGQIVTIFDLGRLLGYEPQISESSLNCVILKPKGNMVENIGFAVDHAEDVLVVEEQICKNAPINVDREMKEKLRGVAQLEDTLLLIIDEDKLFFS